MNPKETTSIGGVIGCFAFLYGTALLFLAAAWFGVPIGDDHHGLNVILSRNQIRTNGKVIRFDVEGPSDARTSTPVIEFLLGKERFRFRGEGMDTHPFSEGDDVPVAYPAGHPELAYIRTFRQMYFGSILMLIFASPFLALALWGTYANLHGRRRKANAPLGT